MFSSSMHWLLVTMILLWFTARCTSTGILKCIEKEKGALLKLKEELVDDYGRLSSWRVEEDCCTWNGVHCDNETGQVTMLDLHGTPEDNEPLSGKISPSLLQLEHLDYLDLSFNDFNFQQIPEFIGSLSNLKYLNLASASFSGLIPTQLANLSRLETLILRGFSFQSISLTWAMQLHSLRYLDLTSVNLTLATDWVETIHELPFLEKIYMSSCKLPAVSNISSPNIHLIRNSSRNSSSIVSIDLSHNDLPSSSIYPWLFNFGNSLRYINLSSNSLQGSIPDEFGNIVFLEHLDLSNNKFHNAIPRVLGSITGLKSLILSNNELTGELPSLMEMSSARTAGNSLELLDLSFNRFTGSIPDISGFFQSLMYLRVQGNQLDGIFHGCHQVLPSLLMLDASQNQLIGTLPDLSVFPSLRELYLHHNLFNGTLPQTVGYLSELETLHLGSNSFEGKISEAHLLKLSRLRVLNLSFNSNLTLDVDKDWIPPFQLDTIALARVKMGSPFPTWLQSQHNFNYIDMSCAGILDMIPIWFWDTSPRLEFLNLSSNHIYGALPDLSSKFASSPRIDLSSNNLSGELPYFPHQVKLLDLSKNKFRGSIYKLCNNTGWLAYLDLSNNFLSGDLAHCLEFGIFGLFYCNMANNNFSGEIPTGCLKNRMLQALHLRNNYFTGEIPADLVNCQLLKIIDFGGNKLSGKIPNWITSVSFPDLMVLSLRSNEFQGILPSEFCSLSTIQILDLSLNHISGPIPKCFDNLTALTVEGSSNATVMVMYDGGPDIQTGKGLVLRYPQFNAASAFLIWKGVVAEYRSTLGLVKLIDLSSNYLDGEIPAQVTSLKGLIALNLSNNNLTGSIPPRLYQLRSLNFLDLSHNNLSGSIPSTISELSHLGVLNLSYNRLSGRIPSEGHSQTFDNSSYLGNSQLCGYPLTLLCPGDETPSDPNQNADEDENEMNNQGGFLSVGFYISMALGFIFGFWGVIGTLVLNKTWRHKFFKSIDKFENWLYLKLALAKARLQM